MKPDVAMMRAVFVQGLSSWTTDQRYALLELTQVWHRAAEPLLERLPISDANIRRIEGLLAPLHRMLHAADDGDLEQAVDDFLHALTEGIVGPTPGELATGLFNHVRRKPEGGDN